VCARVCVCARARTSEFYTPKGLSERDRKIVLLLTNVMKRNIDKWKNYVSVKNLILLQTVVIHHRVYCIEIQMLLKMVTFYALRI
jgi:hypothetical protein